MNAFDDTPHTDDYFVSTDKTLVNRTWIVVNLLTQPWAKTWDVERFEAAVKNSLVFGVYHRTQYDPPNVPQQPKMVAFARVITDGSTYSMVCDVVVDEMHRHRGLAKFIMATITSHPQVRGTVSLLRTANAQKLYALFGYEEVPAMRRIPKHHAPHHD